MARGILSQAAEFVVLLQKWAERRDLGFLQKSSNCFKYFSKQMYLFGSLGKATGPKSNWLVLH